MKIFLKILAGILVVFAVLFIALLIWLDGAILKGFNATVPSALGVPASLEDARVLPMRGKITLNGLHIGNPEGFKTDGLLDVGTFFIRLDTSSVLTDTIIINEILIDGLVVTYEKGLRNSNLGALIDLLSSEKDGDDKKKEEKEEEKDEGKPAKKVIIEKLSITHSKMNFSITGAAALTGGGSIQIPLPAITLTDLGKESEGITAVEAVQDILTALAGATGTAIAGSGKLIGQGVGAAADGAMAIGGAGMDAGKAVAGGAADVGKSVGNAANEAGKAVSETLKNFNPFGK